MQYASTDEMPLAAGLCDQRCDEGRPRRRAAVWSFSLAALIVGSSACTDPVSPSGGPTPASPVLVGLEVQGAGPLTPSFSDRTKRFSVVASGEVDTLTLELDFEPEFTVEIDARTLSGPETVEVVVEAGTTLPIRVSNESGSTREYELLVLPPTFPQLDVSVVRAQIRNTRSYLTLDDWLAIIDDYGVPLFYRQVENRASDFKRHPDGQYSYAVRTGAENEFGARQHDIVVLDEEFQAVDRVNTVGLNHTDNHDFLIRENGNYVLLSYHGVIRDLSEQGGAPDQLVEESVVQEITPGGEVVFQWSSWPDIPWEEGLRDWTDYAHVNSAFIDDSGDFVLSMRGVSQVVKVDGGTGDIIWRLGGISNDFTFVGDPYSNICGQHTAQILESGNLLLFDNGQLCWPASEARGDLTRVAEYALDQEAMIATLVWSYSREGAYTLSQGSSQRLSDGNTLIGWGRGPEILATEVDAEGAVVWELTATRDDAPVVSYRVFREIR